MTSKGGDIEGTFYIAYSQDHEEPIPLIGPYKTYDAAVEAHHAAAKEEHAPAFIEADPHRFYETDDSVRIARVVAGP